MATSNAPEDTDSRTSSVGRKRGSRQTSQDPSTANSSTGESSGASRKKERNNRRNAKARENRKDIRKRQREEDPEEDGWQYLEGQKKQKLQSESEAQGAPQDGEAGAKDSATNAVSWNKGVQPVLRTSFGKKLAGDLKPSVQQNVDGEASAAQSEGKAVDNQENCEPPAWAAKVGIVNADKKEKREAKKGARARKAQAKLIIGTDDLPKPTQKLNVGKDGEEIWVKYSLDHNPRSKRDEKKDRTRHWVNKEVQNRFVPRLLIYNADILDKLDEDKIKEVITAFIAHQPLYDDEARAEAYKATGRQEFMNYCKNQLKKAKNLTVHERQEQGNPPLASENPFGKLLASTDVSNAVSDIDEKEFEEQGGEDMDISMVESNESGEISDDGSDSSDFPKWKTRAAGDRSGRSPSFEPHPVDAAIESRLNNTNSSNDADADANMESKPEIEVIDMTVDTPEKPAKNLPPIPGLPQQLSIALAEVQKYYPEIGARDQPYCLTCSSSGHIAAFCPELTCATCHSRGEHFTYACPQNIICSKCREAGHRAEDCQEKLTRSVADGVVCEICGSTKHIGDNCHLLWRTYDPENITIKKVQNMLVDCYSCGGLSHFGTECGLRETNRMPYAGQSWTAENRARYLEGSVAGGKNPNGRNGNGFAIRGMARNEPIQISDSEEENFIRPKVAPRAPPPQKQHLKFADRVTMPNQPPPPPPRNNNLPMYAQQPPLPQKNWGAVQGNGAYRAENFAMRNGMDCADDYRQEKNFERLDGRDCDDLYRHNPQREEPFRPQNTALSRDPFSTRPPREGKRVRQPRSNGLSGGGRGRGGGVGARGGRGGGVGSRRGGRDGRR